MSIAIIPRGGRGGRGAGRVPDRLNSLTDTEIIDRLHALGEIRLQATLRRSLLALLRSEFLIIFFKKKLIFLFNSVDPCAAEDDYDDLVPVKPPAFLEPRSERFNRQQIDQANFSGYYLGFHEWSVNLKTGEFIFNNNFSLL